MRSPSVLPLFLCDTCRRTTGLLCTSSYVPLKQSTQSSPDINGFVLSNMLGLWLRAAGSVERVVQIPFSSSRKLEATRTIFQQSLLTGCDTIYQTMIRRSAQSLRPPRPSLGGKLRGQRRQVFHNRPGSTTSHLATSSWSDIFGSRPFLHLALNSSSSSCSQWRKVMAVQQRDKISYCPLCLQLLLAGIWLPDSQLGIHFTASYLQNIERLEL
ncbi:DUF636 domain-containing protein [Histoplasma capsulatum]|uniref:DUF636 domain-containing protein n=1 Tax=Ajellomyces capsulatus TaxID=5037 RepID=A0A8A1MAC3_AJECA|nr:DUF636 domain-containing protein [Histoplasma capsulatum]